MGKVYSIVFYSLYHSSKGVLAFSRDYHSDEEIEYWNGCVILLLAQSGDMEYDFKLSL